MADDISQVTTEATPVPPAAGHVIPPPALSPEEAKKRDLLEEMDLVDPSEASSSPVRVAPVAVLPSPPQATPVKHQHSRRTLAMAADLGMPQAEIDSSTPEELDAAVYHANRAFILAREQHYRQAAPQQEQPKTALPKEEDLPWGEWDADGTGVPRQGKDADIALGIVNVLKQQAKELKELKAQLGHISQRDYVREVETTADKIDRYFDAQDAAMFGKGPSRAMPDTDEYSRRLAVATEAQRLAGGDKATRDQVLAKLDVARRKLYPGAPSQTVPPEEQELAERPVPPKDPENGRFTKQQQRWLEAGLVKPTHRANAEEPKGVQRATNALRAKFEEAGINTGDDADKKALEEEMFG